MIFDDVKSLYNLRSRLVHGSRISEKDLRGMLGKISTVPTAAPLNTALMFAVDRISDLVRRAILARLCLASGADPLWRLEAREQVDAVFSDDDERARWRQSWRDTMADLGAGDAANEAAPAVDPLSVESETKSTS